MEKNRICIMGCVLTFLVVVLVACGTPSADYSSGEKSQSDDTAESMEAPAEENDSPGDDSTDPDENNTIERSSDNSAATANESSNQDTEAESKTNDIKISSGTAAIEYLKQQLEMKNNEDIVFGDMGGVLETDEKGSYYTIKLVSKSMRENGGTGTVGIYKVYRDGTYTSKG